MAEPDVDVVVAGAGAAGLAAALSASEQGASVLVAEADSGFRTSCNTVMTASMIPAAGTLQQHEVGVDDSPELFLADIVAKTKGSAHMPLARRLTTISADLIRWLSDTCETPMELASDIRYPGHSVSRCHCVPDRRGSSLHALLLAAATRSDRTTLLAPRRAVGLERDVSGSGRWHVDLARPDGTKEHVVSRSVVLAAGGFGGNQSLVREHLGEIAGAFYFGSTFHRGDAIDLTKSLEPELGCMDSYQGHGSVAVPQYIPLPWPVVMEGGYIVNAAGKRFGDESHGYSGFAKHVIREAGSAAWVVLDGRIDAVMTSMPDYRDVRSQANMHWSESIEELADAIGVGTSSLVETAELVASFAAGRRRDDFGRTDWSAVLEAPFAAVRVTGTLHHTQGGLVVDESGCVRGSGGRIEGLFAAGGSAVGISGTGSDGYLAGNGLIAAVGLGYLGGRAAGQRQRERGCSQ